ncbi:MAG: hypothetical protein VYE22_40990 [Myxococcota bacterium]|nr:hypothetical protein [Myxococcota bacterium]
MSEPAEDLDGAGLLLELLGAVREQGEEIRAQREELRALREALGRRDANPEKAPARSAKAPPRRGPVEVSDTDRAAARKLARKMGLIVREPKR